MPRPAKPDRPEAWVTVATLARVLDVAEQYIRQALLPKLPASAIRPGRPTLYHGRTALELWADSRRRLPAPAGPPDSGASLDDLLKIDRLELLEPSE